MKTTTLRLRHISITDAHNKRAFFAYEGDVDAAYKARMEFIEQCLTSHGVSQLEVTTAACGSIYVDVRPEEPPAVYTHEITTAGCAIQGVGVRYLDDDGNVVDGPDVCQYVN